MSRREDFIRFLLILLISDKFVQAGKTPLPDIKKAVDLLPKEKFLGFVLNRHKAPPKAYYGAYYSKAS